jgi:hypothetical protein
MFLQGSTYPLELLGDADRLAKEASKHPCQDGHGITTPEERTFSRSAILTAFNFLESLLIALSQGCLAAGGVSATVQAEIESDLEHGRANVSRTIKEWPAKLGKSPVHGQAEFGNFCKLRRLRNNLAHPKLQPLQPNELTQDQLLQEANAANAAWAVAEAKKMARVLYCVFGVRVPPEVQ